MYSAFTFTNLLGSPNISHLLSCYVPFLEVLTSPPHHSRTLTHSKFTVPSPHHPHLLPAATLSPHHSNLLTFHTFSAKGPRLAGSSSTILSISSHKSGTRQLLLRNSRVYVQVYTGIVYIFLFSHHCSALLMNTSSILSHNT